MQLDWNRNACIETDDTKVNPINASSILGFHERQRAAGSQFRGPKGRQRAERGPIYHPSAQSRFRFTSRVYRLIVAKKAELPVSNSSRNSLMLRRAPGRPRTCNPMIRSHFVRLQDGPRVCCALKGSDTSSISHGRVAFHERVDRLSVDEANPTLRSLL